MAEFTLAQQVECVRREIDMRLLMYRRWVVQRKMPAEKADYEIACMRAVLATMQGLAAGVVLHGLSQEINEAVDVGGQRSLF